MFWINKYNYFFFDFDGVIADTVNIKTDAYAEIYRQFSKGAAQRVIEFHRMHGGMSRYDLLRECHRQLLDRTIDDEEVKLLANQFSKLVYAKIIAAPFIKGILEFLQKLKIEKKRLYLVSGTPQEEILKIAKGKNIDQYFNVIKGSPVSKREHFARILAKEKIACLQCVYFGDTEEDRDTAKKFEIYFVPINFYDKSCGWMNFNDFQKHLCSISI